MQPFINMLKLYWKVKGHATADKLITWCSANSPADSQTYRSPGEILQHQIELHLADADRVTTQSCPSILQQMQ